MTRAHVVVPAVLLAIAATACRSEEPATISADCSEAEVTMLADAASAQGTWRTAVEELIRTAPPDSIVTVAISVAGTDRQLAEREVAAAGGTVQWMRVLPFFISEIPVSGLAEIYTQSWVLGMSLGRGPAYFLRCQGPGGS